MEDGLMPTMELSKIKIGPRHRKDVGDVRALARNIDEVGLLHPVVVNPSGELIAGARRLAAWKLSKFADHAIPVHVVDLDQIVRGEFSENVHRKDFTPSEMVAIMRALEPAYRAMAKERQRHHGGTTHGRRSAQPAEDAGNALDQIAKVLGKNRKTLQQAAAVVAAHERDPKNRELAGIVERMDIFGNIHGAFKQLRTALAVTDAVPRGARPAKDIFDQMCCLTVGLAEAELRACESQAAEYARRAAFLRFLLKRAAIPHSRSVQPLSELVRQTDIDRAKKHALKAADKRA
jgi:ParB-like chromosome segregation protein Spo0J